MKLASIATAFFLLLTSAFYNSQVNAQQSDEPLRVGVVGLVHTHVHWILGRPDQGDIKIVGIAEPNRELAARYAKQHGFSMDIVFDGLDEMLAKTKPEAVTDFSTIDNHLQTVETCAPLGIHVMVEKPLAKNLEHANKMASLAKKHDIHLLVNYETTWYASNHEAKEIITRNQEFGPIRKIVVHNGHQGPIEIGCNAEFVEWLIDPEFSGGGALTDFGCYGANLATWLMDGQKPLAVSAITQQIKPKLYPKVEDEATIVMTYPNAQAILQASWNWNYNRKDMEVYCQNGFVHCLDRSKMQVMNPGTDLQIPRKGKSLVTPNEDPFSYLEAVVRQKIHVQPNDLSALENNLTVMQILEAAKISAREKRVVDLAEVSD